MSGQSRKSINRKRNKETRGNSGGAAEIHHSDNLLTGQHTLHIYHTIAEKMSKSSSLTVSITGLL